MSKFEKAREMVKILKSFENKMLDCIFIVRKDFIIPLVYFSCFKNNLKKFKDSHIQSALGFPDFEFEEFGACVKRFKELYCLTKNKTFLGFKKYLLGRLMEMGHLVFYFIRDFKKKQATEPFCDHVIEKSLMILREIKKIVFENREIENEEFMEEEKIWSKYDILKEYEKSCAIFEKKDNELLIGLTNDQVSRFLFESGMDPTFQITTHFINKVHNIIL